MKTVCVDDYVNMDMKELENEINTRNLENLQMYNLA